MALTDEQRRFLEGKRFAVLGTTSASGAPHLTIMWYLLDGDEMLFNTAAGRSKEFNLERDPRVSLLVYGEGGYEYLRVDGAVTTITDHATTQNDIRRLASRYYADEARVERAMRESFGKQKRISYRLPVTRVYDYR
jgi:PPOX class probable F420-dependent enzyme